MDTKKPPTKPAASAYRKTGVVTANRETLLLMMYAGAIRFLRQAIRALENSKFEECNERVIKTQNIVNELRATLNFEVGGEIAKNLESLYSYITRQLINGNIERKIEPLKESLKTLEILNEGWEQAIHGLRKERSDKGE